MASSPKRTRSSAATCPTVPPKRLYGRVRSERGHAHDGPGSLPAPGRVVIRRWDAWCPVSCPHGGREHAPREARPLKGPLHPIHKVSGPPEALRNVNARRGSFRRVLSRLQFVGTRLEALGCLSQPDRIKLLLTKGLAHSSREAHDVRAGEQLRGFLATATALGEPNPAAVQRLASIFVGRGRRLVLRRCPQAVLATVALKLISPAHESIGLVVPPRRVRIARLAPLMGLPELSSRLFLFDLQQLTLGTSIARPGDPPQPVYASLLTAAHLAASRSRRTSASMAVMRSSSSLDSRQTRAASSTPSDARSRTVGGTSSARSSPSASTAVPANPVSRAAVWVTSRDLSSATRRARSWCSRRRRTVRSDIPAAAAASACVAPAASAATRTVSAVVERSEAVIPVTMGPVHTRRSSLSICRSGGVRIGKYVETVSMRVALCLDHSYHVDSAAESWCSWLAFRRRPRS